MKYQLVSVGAVLRDYTEPKYINEEHKKLVDIADSFWQAGITAEQLKPEYKRLYDNYPPEWWKLVFKDMGAIESQISGHEQELIDDYNTMLFEEGE